MSDDMRAKFEGWYAKDINPLESFDKNADGTYGSYFLRLSWQGYQQAVKDMEPKWISMDDELPSVLDVRVLLLDGSEINCCAQSDGDFYWKGGGTEMFILDYKVTHWIPKEPKT